MTGAVGVVDITLVLVKLAFVFELFSVLLVKHFLLDAVIDVISPAFSAFYLFQSSIFPVILFTTNVVRYTSRFSRNFFFH